MRRSVLPILIFAALAAVAAQQPQGPGQIRPRPGEGREPEFPAPKITDYKPKSTLVVPQHPVPRAKFPVVDIHGHPPNLTSPAAVDQFVATMDPLNLQVMVNANGTSGDRLVQWLDAIKGSKAKDRMVMLTQLDLRDVGPGSGQKIAAQL